MIDSLGDRMKLYEGKESDRVFIPLLPICIRLDGTGFSKFTRGLQRPYDPRMITLMQEVTKFLVKETDACCGYTQSDEISLILYSANYDSKTYFDGRIQKLVSVLASLTTAKFNQLKVSLLPETADRLAYFDCRAWQVPNKEEAVNTLLWREKYAKINSIYMLAQHYFSHKELLKKTSSQKHKMLLEKGIDWNDYSLYFRYGTYIQRRKLIKSFSVEDLSKLPPKHRALQEPTIVFGRTEINIIDFRLSNIQNKVNVIFDGHVPV